MENCDCNDSINKGTKKLASSLDLISTSYHEAGHTIYGLLHFMKITSVYVYKEDDRIVGDTNFIYFGYEKFNDKDLLSFFINADISMLYAGFTCEKYNYKNILGLDNFPSFLKSGSFYDLKDASILFRKYNIVPAGKKRLLYKKKLIKNINFVIEKYWNDIKLIAFTLVKKKKIFFPDLKNILTKKSENKEFWKKQFKIINHYYKNIDDVDEIKLKSILVEKGLL
jgi:hypothetical protein